MEKRRLLNPIRLEPILIKTSWAGTRLKKIRGYKDEKIGIIREVCAYKNSENKILNMEHSGMLISDLIRTNQLSIMGNDNTNQLIRVAYIDSIHPLSVQVHPNETIAKDEGDYEKTESWYVVDCKPGSYLIAGTLVKDKELFKELCLNGKIGKYLNKIYVEKGDLITIPAGLVHACGADMLVIEVGSFGGITYRLFDYNSDRELHLEKGLKALDLNLTPIINKEKGNKSVYTDNYVIEVIDIVGERVLKTNNKYQIIVNVGGKLEVETKTFKEDLPFTRTLLIPAMINEYFIRGKGRLLMGYRP